MYWNAKIGPGDLYRIRVVELQRQQMDRSGGDGGSVARRCGHVAGLPI
jgi:hypothetical protein